MSNRKKKIELTIISTTNCAVIHKKNKKLKKNTVNRAAKSYLKNKNKNKKKFTPKFKFGEKTKSLMIDQECIDPFVIN